MAALETRAAGSAARTVNVAPGDDTVKDEDMVRPKPQIGLLGATTFGMGCIIGSGIFISPKGALKYTGSVGMSLVVWSVSGIMTMVFGLVYGELGTLVPHSGGDYTYIYMGIGAVPAFLIFWAQQLIGNSSGLTVLSLVFADYFCTPIFGTCGAPDGLRKTIAAVMLTTLCITNIISVKIAESTQIIFTIAKISALAIISVGGIVVLAEGRTENLQDTFEGSSTSVDSYVLALYSCMFAYSAAQRINEITEELVDPKRNIPRAIVISVAGSTVIYILANISYFALISKSEFLKSSAVAYDWGRKVIKPAAIIIPISVMCSVFGASNGQGFATGRVVFAAARKNQFPEVFSYLHANTAIPVISIISTHGIALLMLIPGEIEPLINLLSFIGSVVILLTTISLLRIRSKVKIEDQVFRTPLVIPLLSILMCLFLIIGPFVSSPRIELLYGIAILFAGLVFYVPFVYFKLTIPGFDHVVIFIQLLFQICPTPKVDY